MPGWSTAASSPCRCARQRCSCTAACRPGSTPPMARAVPKPCLPCRATTGWVRRKAGSCRTFSVQWSDAETEDRRVATLGRGAAEALRGGELRRRHDRSGAARRPCRPARASARRLPRPASSGDRRGAQQRRLHDDVDRAVADPVPRGGRACAPDVGDGGRRNARAACGRRRGCRRPSPTPSPCPIPGSRRAMRRRSTSSRKGSAKTVRIEPCALLDDADAVAALAVAAVGAGARVLVLRNTVNAAIATQVALEALLPTDHPALFRVGEIVTLHHGRFAAEDRKTSRRGGRGALRQARAARAVARRRHPDARAVARCRCRSADHRSRPDRRALAAHRPAAPARPVGPPGRLRACPLRRAAARLGRPDALPAARAPRHRQGAGLRQPARGRGGAAPRRRRPDLVDPGRQPAAGRGGDARGAPPADGRGLAPAWLRYWQEYKGGQGAAARGTRGTSASTSESRSPRSPGRMPGKDWQPGSAPATCSCRSIGRSHRPSARCSRT